MTPPPSTLVELVDHAADRWPDQTMLLARQGDQCTYGEYRDRVAQMAAGLRDVGVGPGDIVSWILPTWVDTVVLAGALARLGAVQNPIITIYRDREVSFCWRQAGTSFLVTPGDKLFGEIRPDDLVLVGGEAAGSSNVTANVRTATPE